MWAEYRESRPGVADEEPVVECFGDSAELADELLGFVLGGTKRATTALVAAFADESDPLPRIGSHWVACNGSGEPRVILRTIELRIGPLNSVDEQFAWEEREYERTLESWWNGHRAFFGRSCEELGIGYSDELEAIFERFEVVWPPQHADS